jgi:hypothetical protein
MFTTLLDMIADVTDLVVTADALHAQRGARRVPARPWRALRAYREG